MLATFWGPFKSRVDAVSESVTVREVIDRLDALILEPLFQVRPWFLCTSHCFPWTFHRLLCTPCS